MALTRRRYLGRNTGGVYASRKVYGATCGINSPGRVTARATSGEHQGRKVYGMADCSGVLGGSVVSGAVDGDGVFRIGRLVGEHLGRKVYAYSVCCPGSGSESGGSDVGSLGSVPGSAGSSVGSSAGSSAGSSGSSLGSSVVPSLGSLGGSEVLLPSASPLTGSDFGSSVGSSAGSSGSSLGSSAGSSSGSEGSGSSGAGSGSSGRQFVVVPCCPNPIPTNLFLTFYDVTGDCVDCFLPQTIQVVYVPPIGSTHFWEGSYVACGRTSKIRFTCRDDGMGPFWYLESSPTVTGCSFTGGPEVAQCSPFFVVFENLVISGGPPVNCCNGTVSVIITE